MGSTLSAHPARTAGRLSGRALIVLVAAITSLIALSVLINDIVRVIYIFDGAYSIEAQLASHSGVAAELSGGADQTEAYLWTVLLSSQQQLGTPKALQALAVVLTSLTFVAGAATVLLLCRRLWARRTFAASAAVGLLAVSGLTLLTAWLAPWLRHRADELALESMGYTTSGGNVWVELPYYDAWMADGPALLLGVILALVALVYLGARRLQHDTEGLI